MVVLQEVRVVREDCQLGQSQDADPPLSAGLGVLLQLKIAAVLVEVGQMTRPIRALFTARILLRVLGRLLTGKGPAVPERLG